MIDKVKIYNLIKSQVPEFVREDYPTFIAFLEAYYEYLDSIYVDVKDYRSLENTVDDFIQYFRRELAYNIPKSEFVDDKFLISRAKDIYEAKGSPASYNLLFRLLFNKDVDVKYPYSQVLKPSDGKWNRDTSIFVRIEYGDPNDIIGRIIEVVSTNKIISVFVNKAETVGIDIEASLQVSENIYEIFIDKNLFAEVSPGDFIQYEETFKAEILPVTSGIEIIYPGKGFKAGQIFPVEVAGGKGAIIKIKRVDSEGKVISAELVRFGLGHNVDFNISIDPNQDILSNTNDGYLIVGDNVYLNSSQNEFTEYGTINTFDYNSDSVAPAFEGSYAGSIVGEFSYKTFGQPEIVVGETEPASFLIKLGALATYPGYYSSNDGFLSDTIYLQDSKYYQAFSYVLSVDMQLNEYGSIVKDILHPSGMALFGEYAITNEVDLSVYVESTLSVLFALLDDFVVVNTTDYYSHIGKRLDDEFSQSTITTKSFGKLLDKDQFSLTDTNTKYFGKGLASNLSGVESIVESISMVKSLSDEFNQTESVSNFITKYINSDIITISDSILPTTSTIKALSDDVAPMTESGSIFKNPYVVNPADYWDVTYTEGLTTF